MTDIHPHDRTFVEDMIGNLPKAFKRKILKQYLERLKKSNRKEANLYLLGINDQIQNSGIQPLSQFVLNADENDLKALAETTAKKCIEIWGSLKSDQIEIPYKRIVAFMARRNIYPSTLKEEPSQAEMLSIIRRSTVKSWWLSNLRRRQNRDIETAARTFNFIRKNAEKYASDLNVKRRQWQKKQQDEFLNNMLATNELGDTFLLSELKATSVSNPYIRKSELMVRCRGFEEYAKANDEIALFITMTCPGKYHRAHANSGDPIEKWNGSTAKDAQDYLSITFSRIRTALNRDNIRPYGFRVAEPHHDGTPHWHLLLFMPKDSEQRLKEIFFHYCFEEDGLEDGADQHRLTIVKIDPKKGSATGYIAKYISKNIDGENLLFANDGENPITTAQRIKTWATVWGIRQFQQIGGPQVSIWRELRRMTPLEDSESILERARKAADHSEWDQYLLVMGGNDCPRKDRPINLLYKQPVDTFTGALNENQYGEIKAQSIYGIEHGNVRINTRPHTWEISRVS
ncbi:MAG: replication protein [Methylophaga sp.]|jgi:hypothetical protein|uniref:replication endonuclease n=1 Tax=Methylophaga sp. TaxID=2024840 RepID=UPI000C891AF4|nr:replication endonuclease [Methylophaga sp.]MAL48482.1 replication protein [Methylophaga sp.]|tara:strand:+ start:1233 stop:2777 length:1545 start_codon:yes stop_codon:yes gene_type:complete